MKQFKKQVVPIDGETFSIWSLFGEQTEFDVYLEEFALQQEKGELSPDSCPFGGLLWPSSRGLIQWLKKKPAQYFQRESALELGCGVAPLSCYLAKRGIQNVLATDGNPGLAEVVAKNAEEFGVTGKVNFAPLEWQKTPKHLPRYPLIVASDVLYDNSHLEAIPRLAKAMVDPQGTFLLADPERYRFKTAIENLKNSFQQVQIYEELILLNAEDRFFGTVNRNRDDLVIKIIECKGPLIS